MSRLRPNGFTLIEMMVAVAVFGVMSVLAWGALSNSLSNTDLLTERMNRLQAIQRTIRFLSSDLSQATPRSVRNELGDTRLPAMLSIWANTKVVNGETVKLNSVTINKAFKEGDDWKYTNSFSIEDLPKVALVATEAYKYIRLREYDSQ